MNQLTDRYVDAALRAVPQEQRDDIGAELRAAIADQVDARTADGTAPEQAERDVLTSLGDPDRLAADYSGRPLWLIGPRYYLEWWRLLKVLLWIMLPCAGLGVALANTIAGEGLGTIIGTTVVVVLTAALHVVFWTTLAFVILERTGHEAPTTEPWTPDRLPEPRQSGVGFGDLVAGVVFLAITAGAVLWDHFVGFAPAHRGLSFLDPGLWPWWIGALLLLLALEAILNVVVYAAGRWTVPLAVVNGVLNFAVAVPALWLLAEGRLVNADFWPAVAPGADAALPGVLNALIGVGIVAVALWDTIEAGLKARRSS